jgi:hypothetical protein
VQKATALSESETRCQRRHSVSGGSRLRKRQIKRSMEIGWSDISAASPALAFSLLEVHPAFLAA